MSQHSDKIKTYLEVVCYDSALSISIQFFDQQFDLDFFTICTPLLIQLDSCVAA